MKNLFSFRRQPPEEPFPELEQQIVDTDVQVYGFDFQEGQTPAPRTINKFVVPRLKSSNSVFVFKKETLKIEPVSNSFNLWFEYDASEKFTVCFNFSQTHLGVFDGVPKFSRPDHKTRDFELEIGQNLKFELNHSDLKSLNKVTLESCSFTKVRKFVPILIFISCKSKDLKYYVMCGLLKDQNLNWKILVTKRRIQVGELGYQIQEVYGLTNSEFGKGSKDNDSSSKNCAICLQTPSNTILMPCKHMCVCYECSSHLFANTENCPICRSPVSQVLQIMP